MTNDLKQKLAGNELTIGSWITVGHPSVAEIMARAGFDWLTIDMEHSVITLDVAQTLIQTIEACGVVPLVRVGENHPTVIKRVMDAGARGVIVPMVNSHEDAVAAVGAVRYPPKGMRGVGLARAQNYGLSFEEYAAWLEESSVVIAQVEHIRSVENLEAILDVDGIDGLIIGPYDLSGSLGVPGQFDRPEVVEAISRVLDVARQRQVPAGIHVIPPEPDELRSRVEEGYRFVAFSLDTLFLGGCGRLLEDARLTAGATKKDSQK